MVDVQFYSFFFLLLSGIFFSLSLCLSDGKVEIFLVMVWKSTKGAGCPKAKNKKSPVSGHRSVKKSVR